MSGLPNVQENNEAVLNNIQSLQQIEQGLFNSLETNSNLSTQEQQEIINKINKLSTMRINLYRTLNGVNIFFRDALQSSIGTLKEQTSAISIVEDELNRSKNRLKLLEEEKNNKIRLVEINNYYGDRYAEHSSLMKVIIFTLVPVIIITLLHNKSILPDFIYYILLVIISVIGAVFFWKSFSSIIMRDNMNYDTYDWAFDPKSAPTGSTTSTEDPWESKINYGTCIGEYCCSEGQVYDISLNQCILGNNSMINGGANNCGLNNGGLNNGSLNNGSVSNLSSGINFNHMANRNVRNVRNVRNRNNNLNRMEGFLTETMVNNVLTKTQPDKFKSDYSLKNNYNAYNIN
jgi:hypothetical protein